MTDTAIVWLRNDLRLHDNPALQHALQYHDTVIPVYLAIAEDDNDWPIGAASRSWLHHSLLSLSQSLSQTGSRLILRQGDNALACLHQLITETSATAVYWNRRYEPHAMQRDTAIKKALKADNIDTQSFNSSLLFEPWEICKNDGTAFRVFTPYWKACVATGLPANMHDAIDKLPAVDKNLHSETVASLGLQAAIHWDAHFYDAIQPGEDNAFKAAQSFLQQAVNDYANARDVPSLAGTSRLSVYLHFGEISPRQIIALSQHAAEQTRNSAVRAGIEAFQRELGWREFAHHVLFHYPHTVWQPMNTRFKKFKWRRSKNDLAAWQRGRTGIPLVDAGMRELWHSGYMHNRVRMVVASFLTKNLLIHWREGARWFWDTLTDADLANNTMGWQWTAGSGVDAAPYFRIFNPVSQSKKFDADALYLKRWLPELADIPAKYAHAPWLAPEDILESSGVYSKHGYPRPIIDLAETRKRALERYRSLKT